MARASVQKRQRERKRDEKAAQKREERATREASRATGAAAVATRDDLEGYGLGPPPEERDRGDEPERDRDG